MMINTLVILRESMGLEAMMEKYGMQRSHRRKFLKDVGVSLMIPQVEKRRNAYATAVGISNRLQMSFVYSGFLIHIIIIIKLLD